MGFNSVFKGLMQCFSA